PELVRTIATTAERLGFATIWAPEHVVLLEDYESKYPYSSGKFPGPADTPIADPFTTLAYAAACTSKIRLGTGICLVPEHNPLVLAKTVATVDRLSGGRFIFGVGIGWLAEEFQALGISFDRRAQRTREYIEVMRKLWTERRSSHQGEFVNFTEVMSYPKPVSAEGVPSGSEARVVPRYDGWPNTGTGGSASICCPIKPPRRSRGLKNCSGPRAVAALMFTSRCHLIPVRSRLNTSAITTDDLKRYHDAGSRRSLCCPAGPEPNARSSHGSNRWRASS